MGRNFCDDVTYYSQGAAQHRDSHRDSTSRPWNFLKAEFPLDARVTPVDVLYSNALSPLTTLGNSTTREECAASKWKKVTVQEWKKGGH